MKLVFIWSKEYQKVSATGRSKNNFQFENGFTLLSEYDVQFFYEKKELNIRKRTTEIKSFFGKNIHDVIAIVGKNGTGKTTALSMLAEESCHIQYEYDFYDREYIKIFEEDNSIVVFFCLNEKLRCNVEKDIKVRVVDMHNMELAGQKLEHNFSGVFISNSFEWRDFYGLSLFKKEEGIIEYNFAKKMRDIMLYPEDMYGAVIKGEGKELTKIKTYGQRMEKNALNRVMLYQLRLLVKSMRNMPAEVRREFSGVYGSFNIGVKEFSKGFNFLDENEFETVRKIENCVGYRETRYFLYACYQCILCEACYFFPLSVYEMIKHHFTEVKAEIVDIEFLHMVINKLKKDITSKKNAGFDITNLQWFHQLSASVSIFEKYRDERFYIGSYSFASQNGKRFLEFLEDIFNQENLFFERIITFKSYPASTGENVLANFFAYIYDSISFKTKENEDIAIFIDEIDANLHPKWQQSILWYLVKFLNSLEGSRFQIIFTTHSPIILSDLTEERIIRLGRDKSKIEIMTDTRQTFGANIMKLYYDDFFMEDGSIGEFAKKKIQAVIDYINGKNKHISYDEVKYIIDHVGEPTVKKQLKKMLMKIEANKEQELLSLIKEIGIQEAINCLRKRGKND